MRLRIRYRGPRYADRTLALETRQVRPVGVELDYQAVPSIGGLFQAVSDGSVDVAEVLLGDVVAAAAAGDDRVVALPIFPARRFAQRCLFARHDSPLSDPADLHGARVGWPAGAATAAVWVRALIADAGAEAEFVQAPIGGSLARILDRGASGERPLAERLADGQIEAFVTPYEVPADEGGGDIRLVVADPGSHERAQARAGRGIPINNVVVVRRAVYEEHRWIACSLVDAFAEAQALGRARLNYFGALAVSLPFLSGAMEEIDELFGGEAFPYGLPANRTVLEEFVRHAAALGIAQREVPVEELFPPEVHAHPGVPDTTHYGVPMIGTP